MTLRILPITLLLFVSCSNSTIRERGCDRSLSLPPGFCATIFADDLGAVRHVVVAPNGDVYAARWRNREQQGGLIALRDSNSDGRADIVAEIANDGGSGIALKGDFIYMSTWTTVLRYRLDGRLTPHARPDSILIGLPESGHAARSIAVDSSGNLFVSIGAPTNNCQLIDRGRGSMGRDPCPERDAFAAIWRFDGTRTKQRQTDGMRFVSGLRHAVAFAIDPWSQGMFAVPHGRDDLHENFPALYDEARGERLPAEALYRISEGADYGWPYCYYDDSLSRHVLAPEYGGDGRRSDRCEQVAAPLVVFPAHWAPNGLLFYSGAQFPERYRNGAFVAFHGAGFRRAPNNGFNVVFVPTRDGNLSRQFEIFADGFAGRHKSPGRAKHRPVGLAEGQDGSLYITDDAGGRIWRVTYTQPQRTN